MANSLREFKTVCKPGVIQTMVPLKDCGFHNDSMILIVVDVIEQKSLPNVGNKSTKMHQYSYKKYILYSFCLQFYCVNCMVQ